MRSENRAIWLIVMVGDLLVALFYFLVDTIVSRNKGCHSDGCLWIAFPQVISVLLNLLVLVLFCFLGLSNSVRTRLLPKIPVALGLAALTAMFIRHAKDFGFL